MSESKRDGRLMSIREVSELTGVPTHTLRFWEKEMPDVLCPERTPGGQRRYDREMAERIHVIKRLADERRYSLAAIRERFGFHEKARHTLAASLNDVQTERALEVIIDEIAELLKQRLEQLFGIKGADPKEGANREFERPAITK